MGIAAAVATALLSQNGPTPPRLYKHPVPELGPLPQGTMLLVPRPPVYPYGSASRLRADAAEISRGLTEYIEAWKKGSVPARLPTSFLPPGTDLKDFPSFTLRDPAVLKPEDAWVVRPARPVDFRAAYGSFPDPNCTYLVVPAFYAPFGSRLIIEGEFPHARFMSIQVTPSFDPQSYHYNGSVGVGEVPVVDADIEPFAGHTNPFRVGADRGAKDRSYRVEFAMAMGDPVALNPAFRPPFFRQAGNLRTAGAIMFQGPWGHPQSGGHRRGLWNVGQVWIRYYLPDRDKGQLAGVPLPRIWCEMPDGGKFWIQADTRSFYQRVNRSIAVKDSGFKKPDPKVLHGPQDGWVKQAGIFRSIVTGIALGTGWGGPEYVRMLDQGVAGRGERLSAPNRYEQSATSCTYIDYLVRGMSIERGKVVVLAGRLPTFPDTYASLAPFAAAQMRYWSLTGYEVPQGFDFLAALDANRVSGVAVQSLRDDELELDNQRRYIIALSRPGDRPSNAQARNGVTWRDWGPAAEVSWTLRWLHVGPEWTFDRAPSPKLLGSRTDWASPDYDPLLTQRNSHRGILGDYQPRIHYMTRAEFERLGQRPTVESLPIWK